MWPLVKMSVVSWRQDHASSMGAALAYYTLFSIAPVLIIVIAVAGFFFGAEAASGEIVTQLRGLLGDDGAAAVQGLLESASEPAEGTVRDDLQHCATAPRRDDRLRRAAERSRPHLARGGSQVAQRPMGVSPRPVAVVRDGSCARVSAARFARAQCRACCSRQLVGRMVRRVGGVARGHQLHCRRSRSRWDCLP